MNRDEMISRLRPAELWDLVVIGGGATGLGTAVEAASRGLRTLLLEQSDFAKGTSSRSTKLVHGGVRYLRQGHLPLVRGALRERGLLRQNAPHLVRKLPFVLPVYQWLKGPFYWTGLKIYDLLSGKLSFGPSQFLSRAETMRRVPALKPDGLIGGVLYFDAQFDDARLAVALALTAADHGAALVNYMPVRSIVKQAGRVAGVVAEDLESGQAHQICCKCVVNATGVFCDSIRRMDDPGTAPLIAPSQGSHIVLDRNFLPGATAVIFPKTDDGRVLFALPWENRVIVGTTDIPVAESALEPKCRGDEIDYLLEHAGRFLNPPPARQNVLSVFAGLRPLVGASGGSKTSALSRDHCLIVSGSGLVTITGGKWTTYRQMAEDAVDRAAASFNLPGGESVTKSLKLHGWRESSGDSFDFYGSDSDQAARLASESPDLALPLHARIPCTGADIVWAVRREMARTLEDVLARRTRALFLDAQAAAEIAPKVAELMARELNRDKAWQARQLEDFKRIASAYLPSA